MNVCTTCGSSGPLEKHHVGRRKYSSITTMLCVPCHTFCTIADCYERQWTGDDSVILRLWAGVMDIWDRFVECNNLSINVTGILNYVEYHGVFRYKPCSAIAQQVEQNYLITLPGQITEIARLIGEVIRYIMGEFVQEKLR